MSDEQRTDDGLTITTGRGDSHVEEEAVDLGIGPESGLSPFSPMGQVEATRRVAMSSAVHRPGWPRNVVLACIFGIPGAIAVAFLLGWIVNAIF